jgi:hypothetical protein
LGTGAQKKVREVGGAIAIGIPSVVDIGLA